MFPIYRFRHYATCNEGTNTVVYWQPGCPHFRDTIVTHDVSKQKSLLFKVELIEEPGMAWGGGP